MAIILRQIMLRYMQVEFEHMHTGYTSAKEETKCSTYSHGNMIMSII